MGVVDLVQERAGDGGPPFPPTGSAVLASIDQEGRAPRAWPATKSGTTAAAVTATKLRPSAWAMAEAKRARSSSTVAKPSSPETASRRSPSVVSKATVTPVTGSPPAVPGS